MQMRILILVGYSSARNEILIERLRDTTSTLVTRTIEVSSALLWLTTVQFDVVVLESKIDDGRGADLMYAAQRLPPRPGVVVLDGEIHETRGPQTRDLMFYDDYAPVETVLASIRSLAKERRGRRGGTPAAT
jgi:hypothetical protein